MVFKKYILEWIPGLGKGVRNRNGNPGRGDKLNWHRGLSSVHLKPNETGEKTLDPWECVIFVSFTAEKIN